MIGAALALSAGAAGCAGSTRRAVSNPAVPAGPIPARLVRQARPIGRGARFHPPARGPVAGRCRTALGPRYGAHLEVFAANRVVLVAAGIGTRAPRRYSQGRISSAGCYGAAVTLDRTGVVLVSRTARPTVGDVFRSWGRRLDADRLLSFGAGAHARVRAFVDGRRWTGSPPSQIPLRPHSEIVLEIGPPVPPHTSYRFPPGL